MGNFRKLLHALAEQTQKRFHYLLSIRGNHFIAHRVYDKQIFHMLSQHLNFDSFFMDIQTHAEPTRKQFHRMLCIWGNNFIACWAYKEIISSLAEHKQKWFHRLLSQRRNFSDKKRGMLLDVGWDSTTKGVNHLQHRGGLSSLEGETCLWRGRLVYGGGDSSMEGKSHLRRGRFVYGGETFLRYIFKKISHSRKYERQGTEDKRWRNRGCKTEE